VAKGRGGEKHDRKVRKIRATNSKTTTQGKGIKGGLPLLKWRKKINRKNCHGEHATSEEINELIMNRNDKDYKSSDNLQKRVTWGGQIVIEELNCNWREHLIHTLAQQQKERNCRRQSGVANVPRLPDP